jgi:hypothetical protein
VKRSFGVWNRLKMFSRVSISFFFVRRSSRSRNSLRRRQRPCDS